MNCDKLAAAMFTFDAGPLTEEHVLDFLIHNSNNVSVRNFILYRLTGQ